MSKEVIQVRTAHRFDPDKLIDYLNEKLGEIPAIETVKVREGCTHSYYVQPFKFKEEKAGIHRLYFCRRVSHLAVGITVFDH